MKIKIKELHELIVSKLTKTFSVEESSLVADYLIWAEMSGIKTQGIIKMSGPEPLQDILPKSKIIRERETNLSCLLDGGANPAPLVTQIGTNLVIEKALTNKIAIVGIRNIFSSNGSQAYYLERIAKANLIGFMCSRSPQSTTGFNSIDPLFGTNPLGFSMPSFDHPLVFDMATSALTFYGLVLARARGEKIPENMAIDKDGNLTTDPTAAMSGALLPFDRSYKGSGLSLMVELLAGPLVNAFVPKAPDDEQEWGSLLVAITPDLLVDLDAFKRNASEMLSQIKNSRLRDGSENLRLPGERARESRLICEESGEVEVDDVIFKKIGFV